MTVKIYTIDDKIDDYAIMNTIEMIRTNLGMPVNKFSPVTNKHPKTKEYVSYLLEQYLSSIFTVGVSYYGEEGTQGRLDPCCEKISCLEIVVELEDEFMMTKMEMFTKGYKRQPNLPRKKGIAF